MCSNVSSKNSENTYMCAVQGTGVTSARTHVKKEPAVN